MTTPPLPPRFQMLSDLQSGTMEVCRADAVQAYGDARAHAEREACIEIVTLHGGSVEIEASIRARGTT